MQSMTVDTHSLIRKSIISGNDRQYIHGIQKDFRFFYHLKHQKRIRPSVRWPFLGKVERQSKCLGPKRLKFCFLFQVLNELIRFVCSKPLLHGAFIWAGEYSYIRVLPLLIIKLISGEISWAEHEYINNYAPPPN